MYFSVPDHTGRIRWILSRRTPSELRSTYCFQTLTDDEWAFCLDFLVTGGSLSAYDDYQKVEVDDDGRFVVTSRKIARRHHFSIGAIVSDTMIPCPNSGKEERWAMWKNILLRVFRLVMSSGLPGNSSNSSTSEMTATVQPARGQKKGVVTSYMGSRMPLSAQMGAMLRKKLQEASEPGPKEAELQMLRPMLELQEELSLIPNEQQFLVEYLTTKKGIICSSIPSKAALFTKGWQH